MAGRIVVITGATGGLGSSVTSRFLESGDTVVGASRRIQQSDFPATNFLAISTDFANPLSVRQLSDTIIQRFGRIDVLVHVVGGFAGGSPLHETGDETWAQLLTLNLNAAFNVIRAIIPRMREVGSGRFIAVGSKTADRPRANMGAYVVSKIALASLVQTVALENADHGITANVVLPGTMDTAANRAAMPEVDPRSWLHPAEVANLIFYLASDEAQHTTGAAIPIG